jgi:hypothetical protein
MCLKKMSGGSSSAAHLFSPKDRIDFLISKDASKDILETKLHMRI